MPAARRDFQDSPHAIGIEYVAQPGYELPMLNAVSVPEGVDDVALRKRLLDEFNIEIGGGLVLLRERRGVSV